MCIYIDIDVSVNASYKQCKGGETIGIRYVCLYTCALYIYICPYMLIYLYVSSWGLARTQSLLTWQNCGLRTILVHAIFEHVHAQNK